jgi:hypothetical protein
MHLKQQMKGKVLFPTLDDWLLNSDDFNLLCEDDDLEPDEEHYPLSPNGEGIWRYDYKPSNWKYSKFKYRTVNSKSTTLVEICMGIQKCECGVELRPLFSKNLVQLRE